jgi:hypothetical protein
MMLRMETNHWAIDSEGNCGMPFRDSVIVLEPLSKNPCIQIPHVAFGLRGLKQAIEFIEQERRARGIFTPVSI